MSGHTPGDSAELHPDAMAGLAIDGPEGEARFQFLYQHTPVMMHSIDRHGRLVSVSNAWLEALGYAWEEVIGRKSVEFLAPGSQLFAQEVILPEYFRTGRCKDVPYQFVRKDGSILDGLMSAIAERDAAGEIVRSLAVITDVTAYRRAESERQASLAREQAARAEAEAAHALEHARQQFLNTVSHELRTPLTSIQGYAELLEDGEVPLHASQARYVAQIKRGAERVAGLVDDLLDVARMDAGTFVLQRQPTDLAAKASEAAESVGPQLQEAGLTLAPALAAGLPALALDPRRICQVWLNLLSNAIKFSPRGGVVHLRVLARPGVVRGEVEDAGPGIAPADAATLFRRFGQLEAGRRQSRGTGLGLYICKAIVEAHGGTIGVTSEPGRGSTFWFELPA